MGIIFANRSSRTAVSGVCWSCQASVWMCVHSRVCAYMRGVCFVSVSCVCVRSMWGMGGCVWCVSVCGVCWDLGWGWAQTWSEVRGALRHVGSRRQAPWEVEEEEWRELMRGEGRIPWSLKLAVLVLDLVAWPGWGRAGLRVYCWDGETQDRSTSRSGTRGQRLAPGGQSPRGTGWALQATQIMDRSPHEMGGHREAVEGSLEASLRALQLCPQQGAGNQPLSPSVTPRTGLAEGRAGVGPLPRPLNQSVPGQCLCGMNAQPCAASVRRASLHLGSSPGIKAAAPSSGEETGARQGDLPRPPGLRGAASWFSRCGLFPKQKHGLATWRGVPTGERAGGTCHESSVFSTRRRAGTSGPQGSLQASGTGFGPE